MFTGGSVSTNGYLLEGPEGLLVVDAPRGIVEAVKETGLKPQALLLTHQHFDHVEDAAALARLGATIYAWSPWSSELILDEAARRWGLPVTIEPFTVDSPLSGQDGLTVAGLELDLRHVPGHSPDSVVFHLPEEEFALAGDTLFAGSIGRTDLPGGRHRDLLEAIRTQLFTLAPTTRILPGHGPETTIAQEVAANPYLQ
jgi:glyoxylase-like metal-dependent hydrolase (beta-lactamase superfamily II)